MTQLRSLIEKLVKGGETDAGNLYLTALKQTQSDEPKPEPEELEKVIKEVLEKHNKSTKIGIELVTNWVNEQPGEFDLPMIYSEKSGLNVNQFPRDAQPLVCAVIRENLHRLVQKGVIVASGKKRGVYRKVEAESEPLDWINAPTESFPVSLPLGLDNLVNLYPGNIIIVAGEKDTGKTAFCLDFIKRNMNNYEIHYFSSEMGPTELKKRLEKHEDLTLDEWKFFAWQKPGNFSDSIKKDKINIVDFLETDADKAYLAKNEIRNIFDKLGKGLALVAIQKYSYKEYGYGGAGTIEKARLYITLAKNPDHQGATAKIMSAKDWKTDHSPAGKTMVYKLVGGAKFIYGGSWEYAESRDAVRRPGKLY